MLIKIIVVGKLKDRMMLNRCNEFLKWIGRYAKVDLLELPDSMPEREGKEILRQLERENSYIIALSEEGKEYSSVDFAQHINGIDQKIVFIIGGPFGLSEEVKARANQLWSLSQLTFTHEIARLLLFEQLYRAMSIIHNRKYHNI